jgi:prepilin-type N-terminal cleavage/methylation domain-containing protein
MTEKGVTLVELLVVVSIIGILAVAFGFSVEGWLGRYNVESATRQLYADMQDARTRALEGDSEYFAVISTTPASSSTPGSTTYSIIDDTDNDGTPNDAPIATFPKTVSYAAKAYDSSHAAVAFPIRLTFSKRGIITPLPAATGEINIVADNLSDYNCTTIGQTMIGLGKMVCSSDASIACIKDSDCSSGGSCSVCQVK